MIEKIVIITGASSGIGKAAAYKFAEEGFTVVLGCRNLSKSKMVQEDIINKTKNPNIDLFELDISSFSSIVNFANQFKNKYQKLDILINNAAYINHSEKKYQLSKDHIELSFATNVIGPFLLNHMLVDMLNKSDDPRILNACTTNIRYFFDKKRKIDFNNLHGEDIDTKPYAAYKLYGDSKMALFMTTIKFSNLELFSKIKINAIQISAIKISKETINRLKFGWRIAARIQNLFSASQDSMAETYYYLCTANQLKNVTGKLFNANREIMKPSPYKKGIIEDLKQFLDQSVYPLYAEDFKNQNLIWNMCINDTKIYLKELNDERN